MPKHLRAILVTILGAALIPPAHAAQAQDQSQKPAQPSQPAASQNGQSQGQAAPGAQGQAAPATPAITPDESKAYNAIQNELDPSRQIKMVDDFAKKYPNQPMVLSDVYFFGANAAQQQNDVGKAVDYGYKSLQENPNNFKSLMIMAGLLPQPQAMQGSSDADREKKLGDAESYANKALQAIPDIKPPNMAPEQVTKVKANLTAEIHGSLGMVHLQRALAGLTGADPQELAKAEQEYKASVTGIDKPNPEDYFRLGEVYEMENKVDEAIDAFTQCSKISQGQLQTMANQQIDKLKKAKAQSAPPAKP